MTTPVLGKMKGMSDEEAELFLIAQHNLVYLLREDWQQRAAVAEDKREAYNKAEREALYAEQKLRDVLRFLSLYNSAAHDDWFAEFVLSADDPDNDGASVEMLTEG